ncbi:MAG: DUF4097 family beta strand repeat-containing protein [Bryobacteraceae bacterium]|jgi:DUF4097 and DUF4098 domain-containing protein YvlB
MRAAFALLTALLLSGCVIDDFESSDRYQEDFHYTWDLQADGRVNAESFNGSIEITGWDQNKVEIFGTKFASTKEMLAAVKIDIHHTPEAIEIRAVKPSFRMGGMGARFTMHVPRHAQLDRITASNSAIRVHDVARAAHLQSSNGSIKAGNVGGDVEARTSNGSIDVESVIGAATLRTSNGRIHAENVEGALDADTSNGAITVRLESAPGGPLRLMSSNGSIDLTLTKAPRNTIRAETRNNSITVHLPSATAARVIADTANSDISSEFDLTTRYHHEGRKNHLDGMIAGGGPNIQLSTNNGRIRILRDHLD